MRINNCDPSAIYPRLKVYSDENYCGRRAIYRGNLGIANLGTRLNGIESLKFFSTSSNATLVLFTRRNFKGSFRVFRGNTNIRDLNDIIGGCRARSLISSNNHLTLAQIRAIRDCGKLPEGYRYL